ncbi:Response regulator receiver protein [Beggiatoa sp. PS]|nr:Response regulator receiver protein [Beggiatoa sp. PS]
MSHELRTPLNSLLILAQLLASNKEGNLTDKQTEYAQTIHSAGSDLLTLINEILDLSKIEAGKIEVQVEKVSLADLQEAVDQKFRHVAEEKKLAFPISMADDLSPVINTDGQRLKQILNNLLSNAFKFTSQGEVRLEIQPTGPHPSPLPAGEGTGPHPSPLRENLSPFILENSQGHPPLPLGEGRGEGHQKTIAFSVTDTGVGIPKNKQQVIFEAFQQADGTTSRRFGGTGLGLSISRQLARLLGGELHLQSEEGKGSTFTLYLPEKFEKKNSDLLESQDAEGPILSQKDGILTASTETSKVSQNESAKTTETLPPIIDDRNNLTPEDKVLLIIEDERKFSRLLMDLAQENAFKCLVAEDGETSLQLAEQYKPHAIILDVGLPQVDGWTVMERLKDNQDTRHIPVYFISASDQVQEAKKMGAIGYLLKPVGMAELEEAFQNIKQFITTTVKNVLVITDEKQYHQKIFDLLRSEEIQITPTITMAIALRCLHKTRFDCIILDVDIEQGTGINFLEQMEKRESLHQIPLIVYTERDLTTTEEALLLQCAENLLIKSVRTAERLLDEVTLFLHQLVAELPDEKRNMLKRVHDKKLVLNYKKVLIVDDDSRNVFALATVLENYDMEVIFADNGKKALKLLEEQDNIAIVLMDIMMPEMDGYEAMRKIRAQARFRQLPIIALTAKAMKGDKAKCIEAGANDYLAKPVDTDKLISLMRVWLYR